MVALDVKELAKVIDENIIVDRVSFSVEEGEVFGLLGSNGSGKTTTFNMLSGILRPSSGSVEIFGKKVEKDHALQRDIGFVTQQDSFYETLTVKENLEFFASQFGIGGNTMKERIAEILKQIRLTNKKDALASKLSGGMKKRLNMGCSLVHNPRLLFLDEPTVGLDPVVRRDIWKLVKDLHQDKKTIIITSHYMEEVEQLCDRVGVMFAGRIVASGKPEQLKKKYGLKQMEDVFAHLVKRTV